MAYFKRYFVISAIAAAFLSIAHLASAAEDGFDSAQSAEGKHVNVYCAPGIDMAELDRKLNIRPSEKLIAGNTAKTPESPGQELVDMLDTLYMQVGDITDMHLYNIKISVKVCRNDAELASIYENLFHAGLGGHRSFYIFSFNAIYVSADAFSKEILGHEMAHAIICNYFVVPPPVKIQEILAMYVEYNLRRAK